MPSITGFIQENALYRDVLEAIPHPVMIVDENWRIQSANGLLQECSRVSFGNAIRNGIGHALGCVHARDEIAAYGTLESCKRCEMPALVASALEANETVKRSVSMQLRMDGAVHTLALEIFARHINYRGKRFAMLVIDNSDELAALRKPEAKESSGAILKPQTLVGNHSTMMQVYQFIEEVAKTDLSVVIQGETGTGKELVALAIHQASRRAKGPFVPVNCAALPEGLLENELFGHVKGAFTGATGDRKGRFQMADGGSLMLDEIVDLSPSLQVKLLRVLQERRFERLGSNQSMQMDFRVISATNKELAAEVKSGRFRPDLFYRLFVAAITLPPLRERRSDIPLLIDFFLTREAQKYGRPKPVLCADAMAALMEHDWPGNVRELENVIQFAMMKCQHRIILPECLPSALGPTAAQPVGKKCRKRKLKMEIVRNTLHEVSGNRVRAAKLLNVSRSTLYRFMDEATNPLG